MPANMRILGWRAVGFRCPDHDIDLRQSGAVPYSVSLIQMPNGTGKTTTLELLRAALSGRAESTGWNPTRIRALRKRHPDAGRGEFELRLLLNERKVTIIMEFDFVDGTVQYKTTRDDGQVLRFDPPFEFRQFLSPEFVDYFVFDGELANQLLDPRKTNAKTIVDRLFQVSAIKTLEARVNDYWDATTKGASATEEKGYTRRKNRVDTLRERLQELVDARANLVNELSGVEAELKAQQQRYQEQIHSEDSRSQALQKAEKDLSEATSHVRDKTLEVMELMADPHALSKVFASAMAQLKTGLDRVKLPESAAREFFQELAEEENCVCGRPITEEVRGVIRERAERYLGTEDVALLNSIKTSVEDAVGTSRKIPEQHLVEELALLDQLVDLETSARNLRDGLQQEAEQSDPEIAEARNRISLLETQQEKIQRKIGEYDSYDDRLKDDATGIAVIEERLEKAEGHLAAITETLELKAKRDQLKALLDEAYEHAKKCINQEVTEQTNDRIVRLLPNNRIRVERIDESLILEGQSGGSVGEQLSIAYAFLATLFNRSEHHLPFVVDSPAGALDFDVRREVGALVPKLSGQFVAFTIASEREAFVPALEGATNGGIQYITLFREGAKTVPTSSFDDVRRTEDGVCVIGQTYFQQFQEPEES